MATPATADFARGGRPRVDINKLIIAGDNGNIPAPSSSLQGLHSQSVLPPKQPRFPIPDPVIPYNDSPARDRINDKNMNAQSQPDEYYNSSDSAYDRAESYIRTTSNSLYRGIPFGRGPSTAARMAGGEDVIIHEVHRHDFSLPRVSDAVIWDPSFKRDLTIHLELDIEEDIDSTIAGLDHLRRLGRFREADEYLENNLSDHLQDVSVRLSYANLLLEQGDYGRLFAFFAGEAGISRDSDCIVPEDLSGKTAEEVNLALVLQLARCRSDPDLKKASTIARSGFDFLKNWRVQDGVGTKELQILCRSLHIFQTIYESSYFVSTSDLDFYASGWQKWVGHYRSLIEAGRHWDLRDIVVAFVSAFGPVQACTSLFETDSLAAGVSKLVHDWAVAAVDEETSRICLLDILVSICIGINCNLFGDSSFLEVASFAFKQARIVAASIKENEPENAKCRPYLRWILAETEHSRIVDDHRGKKGTLSYQFFKTLPGFTFRDAFEVLPTYSPAAAETPDWPVLDTGSSATSMQYDGLIKAALDTADELGDMATQVACLNEMICGSHDPRSLFADLDRLQSLVMHDKLGLLRTRLKKYLLASRDDYRSELRRELTELNPVLPIWNTFIHPLLDYVYCRIMYALLLSADGDSEEARATNSRATEMEKYFPCQLPHLAVPSPYSSLQPRENSPWYSSVEETRRSRDFHERRPAINGELDIDRERIATRFARASQPDPETTSGPFEVPRSKPKNSKKGS